MRRWQTRDLQSKTTLGGLVLSIIAAAFFYALMEWLFMITKPSFMDALLFSRKLEMLLFTGALLTGLLLLGLAPAFLMGRWLQANRPQQGDFLVRILYLVPAGVVGAVLLLWLDNFTYTVFGYGIVSATGLFRAAYALLFLGFIAVGYCLSRAVGDGYGRLAVRGKIMAVLPYGLVVAVGLLGLGLLVGGGPSSAVEAASTVQVEELPNVLLITSDGVNANHMSVYGYERDTTPYLRGLAESALVAENAFTNSGKTTGSVISMYTGKYPSKTRVIHPPDILRNADSYQHLPGILRSLGYRTVQITHPHYIDASTLNVLNGFDEANGRIAESGAQEILIENLPNDFAYFLYETSNRIIDRVRHIFFIKKMLNPYQLVTVPSDEFTDGEKLSHFMREIQQKTQPLFIHIHFMGTHGERFYPTERVFSQGIDMESQGGWNVDLYDDSILEFDLYMGELLAGLDVAGEFENSILIIGSDHGQQYTTDDRIPLIMRFPDGQYAGRTRVNVQNIDIAPTVLDYLGIPLPEWMDGDSLLQAELGQRPIIGFNANRIKGDWLDEEQIGPPFFQFGDISVVHCNQWYSIDLETYQLQRKRVAGHSAPCSEAEAISEEAIVGLMLNHLAENGFDVSHLKAAFQSEDALQ